MSDLYVKDFENKKPLVSVCISTWKRKEALKKLFDSILIQDYQSIELCVVDNASMDGTFKLIHDYNALFNKRGIAVLYELMPTPHPNAIYTINRALDMGTGEYKMIVDDDAYFDDQFVISNLVETMNTNLKAAIVGAYVRGLDGKYQMPVRSVTGEYLTDDEIQNMGTFNYFEFHGACALFRSRILAMYGGYDKSFKIYMNELDLALRFIARGCEVLINSNARVTHTGVGDINACNGRAKYFVRNYNTCILRNFRGWLRWKAFFLHTFMSCGFYIERILCYNICPKYKVLPLLWSFISMIFTNILDGICMYKRTFDDPDYQDIVEQSFYNGFKKCIHDRFTWLTFKRGLNRGIR